ncbi:MAG: amidohydrolase family protein [Prolixibacteraceae bacterium]|jgi:predicted TIM-barrel fold metal-dependent hydrolase|nr:amidohydrolase family protein [Prolixibacteraceae bacterium]
MNQLMRTTIISILISFFGQGLNAQSTISVLPKPGFEKRIQNAVNAIRLIDTHEHLMSETEALASPADFSTLFTNYQQSDLISSGMAPDKAYSTLKGKDKGVDEKWSATKDGWANMRTTAYGRSVLIAARDLYGIADLNELTYGELSKRIREAHKKGYYETILKQKAKIDACLIMEYNTTNPRDVVNEGNCNFRRFFVYDKYCSFFGYNKMRTRLSNYGIEFSTLPQLESLIDTVFAQDVKKGIQGAKFGVAYYRTLKFDDVSRENATAVFEKMKSNPDHIYLFEEAKPLQDFIFFKLLSLCEKYKLPVQIHTGLQTGSGNEITNANPTGLAKAFFKFPGVKFCLLHAGYPYGGEMATLAKNFPNVYIDMAWSALISPAYTRRYLQEFIETVPNNKIMAYGGDSQTVEGAYGASVLARETVASTLIQMVKEAYLTESEALDVAKKILRENAINIYNLKPMSHN